MTPQIEFLESRRLLSGDWTTVDDFQLAAGKNAVLLDIGTDAAGNVFAVGRAFDSTGEASRPGTDRHRAGG